LRFIYKLFLSNQVRKMEKQVTTNPMVTGGSVLGLKYSDGILLCSDTLGSYGSLALFKEIPRIAAIGQSTLIAASGEYSDFQEIVRLLQQKYTEDFVQHDGVHLNASH